MEKLLGRPNIYPNLTIKEKSQNVANFFNLKTFNLNVKILSIFVRFDTLKNVSEIFLFFNFKLILECELTIARNFR